MNLIIDIPNRILDGAKTSPKFYPTYDFETIWKAIQNGIPLDDLRAEIEEYQKDAFYSDDVMIPKKMILAIIDKYKAESEEQK